MKRPEIIYLGILNVIANLCYSIIIPFVPLELKKFKIHETWNGYVFGSYAFAVVISSFFIPSLLKRFNKKCILIVGLVLMSLSIAGFGEIGYLPNNTLIVCMCIFLQLLQGSSACLVQTTCYTIIAIVYADNQQKYLGIIESCMGVGLLLGPSLGAALYKLLGFDWAYRTVGIALFWFAFILLIVIPNFDTKKQNNSTLSIKNDLGNSTGNTDESIDNSSLLKSKAAETSQNESVVPVKPVGFKDAFSNKIFIMCSISAFYSYFVYCFQEPILSLRLTQFDMDEFWIGMFFLISASSYFFTCMILPILIKGYDNKNLIPFGFFCSGLCMTLVGPTKGLPDSLIIMGFGQFLYATFSIFYLLWPLFEMIIQLSEKFPNQEDEVSDISSSVLTMSYGLGQMWAPVFGSNMTYLFGFKTCADIVGAQLIIFGVLFILVCKVWTRKTNKKDIEVFNTV